MSETPTCDRWKFETDTGAEVVPVDIAEVLEIELERARAEVWRLKTVSLSSMINATKLSSAELKAAQRLRRRKSWSGKDKLIEQMREALDATDEYYLDNSYAGKAHNTPIVVKVREAQAALEAAEGGLNEN